MGNLETDDAEEPCIWWMRIAVSPLESEQSVCKPDTIPSDYNEVTKKLAAEGFYVIAMACRDVGAEVRDFKFNIHYI